MADRRLWRSALAGASASLCALAACGLDIEGVGLPSATQPGADAATATAIRGEDGASPTDGAPGTPPPAEGGASPGPDAGPDAQPNGCTTVIDDDFATMNAGWDTLGLKGGPAFSANRVTLTPGDDYGVQGAIWWKTPITYGSKLLVDVTYGWSTVNGEKGHGIAIAWIATATKYKLGGLSNGMALCDMTGMDGNAVLLDTRDDELAIVGPISPSCPSNTKISGAIPATGTAQITIDAARMTAQLGSRTIDRSRANATTGYFGITSSTSSEGAHDAKSKHWLTRVVVKACP